MRILPVRDDALLVECDSLEAAIALLDALTAEPVPGVRELVPGARTLLVAFDPARLDARRLAREVRGREHVSVRPADSRTVEVPTRYDGEDLAEVGRHLGLATDEVVRRHTASEYTVGFVGFAPGFAYLTDGDPVFDVPRRATPRTRIPAGSVGLAGTYSGVYPRESPGGWQLIGTTEESMWDLGRERPALLQPGDRVRFVEAAAAPRRARVHTASVVAGEVPPGATGEVRADAGEPPAGPDDVAGALTVVAPGAQSLVQDGGRAGVAGLGVSESGALDGPALRAANRLVGNDATAAGIETVAGGLRLRAEGPQVLAVTGAVAPLRIRAADPSGTGAARTAPYGRPFALDDGEELVLGAPPSGARSYLAVRGGIHVPAVLGSRSSDVLAGLGPAPLAPGARLPVGPVSGLAAVADRAEPEPELPAAGGEAAVLDVVLGPRTDWFAESAVRAFAEQEWLVTPQSNRVGLRLEGEPLERRIAGELPSEGTVAGSIQVPPSGQPVLFLADHPLTGGYPIIGAVARDALALAGQLPVGARVRFRIATPFSEIEPAGDAPRDEEHA